MAKWHGVLGFTTEEREMAPGVFEPASVIERTYFGEFVKRRLVDRPAEKLEDDFILSDELSVIADPYAMSHLGTLRYASYGGARWKIVAIDPAYPKLKLVLGGLYHGETPD